MPSILIIARVDTCETPTGQQHGKKLMSHDFQCDLYTTTSEAVPHMCLYTCARIPYAIFVVYMHFKTSRTCCFLGDAH